MPSDELKPCPFCGAAISEHDGGLFHPDNGDVEECPLSAMSWSSDYYRTAWNTRTEYAALKASADEMAEALRDTLAYMRGDIAGPAQRDGILREARQALTAYRNGGNDAG